MANSVDWLVESLRCTVFFPDPPPAPADVTWWEDVAGVEPSGVVLRPREGDSRWTGEVEWPPLEKAVLDLQLQRLRADWRLESTPPADEFEAVGSLGSLDDATGIFHGKLANWFRDCPTAIRLAYGGILLLPADNVESAYDRLEEFLPSLKLDRTSRDFLYRINKPCPSAAWPDLSAGINRITTWTVGAVQSMDIALSAQTVTVRDLGAVVRLEFDMNTAPENTIPVSGEDRVAVMTELESFARESAAKGDVT